MKFDWFMINQTKTVIMIYLIRSTNENQINKNS